MAQKNMIESVKKEIVSAIKGTGDIVNGVIDTVAGTLTNTIKGGGAVATSLIGALSDTARASVQGVAMAPTHMLTVLPAMSGPPTLARPQRSSSTIEAAPQWHALSRH